MSARGFIPPLVPLSVPSAMNVTTSPRFVNATLDLPLLEKSIAHRFYRGGTYSTLKEIGLLWPHNTREELAAAVAALLLRGMLRTTDRLIEGAPVYAVDYDGFTRPADVR